jgi:hypothetical protein
LFPVFYFTGTGARELVKADGNLKEKLKSLETLIIKDI